MYQYIVKLSMSSCGLKNYGLLRTTLVHVATYTFKFLRRSILGATGLCWSGVYLIKVWGEDCCIATTRNFLGGVCIQYRSWYILASVPTCCVSGERWSLVQTAYAQL